MPVHHFVECDFLFQGDTHKPFRYLLQTLANCDASEFRSAFKSRANKIQRAAPPGIRFSTSSHRKWTTRVACYKGCRTEKYDRMLTTSIETDETLSVSVVESEGAGVTLPPAAPCCSCSFLLRVYCSYRNSCFAFDFALNFPQNIVSWKVKRTSG